MDDDCADDECPLSHGDYAWIEPNHPTVVAFSYARAYDVAKLEAAFRSGLLAQPKPPIIPAKTLAKIRKIAATARELDRDLKKLL